MAKKNRVSLKNAFLKGKIPKEKDFQDLIDSCINEVDDGLIKEKGEGFKLVANGTNSQLMSFFENINDLAPKWELNQTSEDGVPGLNFSEPNGGSRLFIEEGGNIGIGCTKPKSKLDVNGFISSQGRKGTFASGSIPADGAWHDVITDLDEYNAFEILASCGKKGAHAILHAIAVATFGKSKPGITKTTGRYGSYRNQIDIRWTGSYFNYKLQLRTRKSYGEGVHVSFNISKLM